MRKPKLTSKEVLRMIGDPAQVAKEMELFAKETIYLGDNYLRLLRLHPDRFVAIYDEEVVGVDKNLVKLINRLRKKNLNMTRVLIRFLATNPRHFSFLAAA